MYSVLDSLTSISHVYTKVVYINFNFLFVALVFEFKEAKLLNEFMISM